MKAAAGWGCQTHRRRRRRPARRRQGGEGVGDGPPVAVPEPLPRQPEQVGHVGQVRREQPGLPVRHPAGDEHPAGAGRLGLPVRADAADEQRTPSLGGALVVEGAAEAGVHPGRLEGVAAPRAGLFDGHPEERAGRRTPCRSLDVVPLHRAGVRPALRAPARCRGGLRNGHAAQSRSPRARGSRRGLGVASDTPSGCCSTRGLPPHCMVSGARG